MSKPETLGDIADGQCLVSKQLDSPMDAPSHYEAMRWPPCRRRESSGEVISAHTGLTCQGCERPRRIEIFLERPHNATEPRRRHTASHRLVGGAQERSTYVSRKVSCDGNQPILLLGMSHRGRRQQDQTGKCGIIGIDARVNHQTHTVIIGRGENSLQFVHRESKCDDAALTRHLKSESMLRRHDRGQPDSRTRGVWHLVHLACQAVCAAQVKNHANLVGRPEIQFKVAMAHASHIRCRANPNGHVRTTKSLKEVVHMLRLTRSFHRVRYHAVTSVACLR